jgi:acyl-CoA thioester hydrolase
MTDPRAEPVTRELRERAPATAITVDLRVPFHDCDPLFVAWHGWYYKYFEIARCALFSAHRIDVPDMIPLKLGLYVIDSRARHVGTLRYGDDFRVAAWFTEWETRLGVAYEIQNLTTGKRAARGKTVLVTTRRAHHGAGDDEMLFETPQVLVDRIVSAPIRPPTGR